MTARPEGGPTPLHPSIGWTLCGLAAATLVAAFAAIAVKHGTPAVWSLPVHEDGVRTFGDTVLYFEHAVRELPLDLLLGVAIGGALAFAIPHAHPARGARVLAAALVLAVALMIGGAARDVGAAGVFDNLLQKHTRPGAPLEWGAHWRYHFVATLSLMLGAFGAAGVLRLLGGTGAAGDARRGLGAIGAALAIFFGGVLMFAHSPAGLAKPFVDPVYVGHAARELFTHALVTLPIAFGAGLLSARGQLDPASAGDRAVASKYWALALGASAALGAYLGAAVLLLGSASQGQTDDLVMLIAPHFFEHAQTYLIVTMTALLVHRLAARAASI